MKFVMNRKCFSFVIAAGGLAKKKNQKKEGHKSQSQKENNLKKKHLHFWALETSVEFGFACRFRFDFGRIILFDRFQWIHLTND